MTQVDLLDQILSGTNRPLQLLAASGMVPLAPEDLLPVQVALTGSPDQEIANRAREALLGIDQRVAANFLAEDAGERELAYFGVHVPQPEIQEAILRRRDTPRSVMIQMAELISPELQEVLILRQDAIVDEPQILVALEQNPQLSMYAKRRIWEYREHLLPRDKVPPKKPEEILAEADAVTAEEIAEAIEEVRERPAEGQVNEETGLSEAQVRYLPVPIRIKMARTADRQLRSVLVRDTNVQVAMTIINGSGISEQEAEQIANSRNVLRDVLSAIAKRREWIRKYAIAKALVKNPRAPLPLAISLVSRMTVQDLRSLARDKNVAEGVRSVALRRYHAKR